MFVRIKKSGKYQYLQIVKNSREWSQVKQTVIANLGRLDKYREGITLLEIGQSLIALYEKLRAKPPARRRKKKAA